MDRMKRAAQLASQTSSIYSIVTKDDNIAAVEPREASVVRITQTIMIFMIVIFLLLVTGFKQLRNKT